MASPRFGRGRHPFLAPKPDYCVLRTTVKHAGRTFALVKGENLLNFNRAGSIRFAPVHRHRLVARTKLIDRVRQENPALILLYGRGGAGKSVTATQLATHLVPEHKAVWVRLEIEKTTLDPFWRHVLTALLESEIVPSQPDVRSLIEGGLTTATDSIKALALQPDPYLLVLDDLARDTSTEVQESILEALEQVPQLTVIITTRHAPSLLRSINAQIRVPITELTSRDLAFSKTETSQLLAERLGSQASTSPAVIDRVFSGSGGWPLAVHALLIELTSLNFANGTSLTSKASRNSFISDFVQKLFESSSPQTREVLCIVGTFGEVSAQTLAELLEISEVDAKTRLENAVEQGLEYWTDHRGADWFSLHDLVATATKQRASEILGSEKFRTIKSRAAAVFEDSRPRIALRSAFESENWDRLSKLLLRGTALSLTRDRHAINFSHVPQKVREQYPVIDAFSIIHNYAFPSTRYGRVLAGIKVKLSRRLAHESEGAGLPGLLAAILRMIVARLTDDETLAVEIAESVEGRIAQLDADELRSFAGPLHIALNQAATTLIHAGKYRAALEALEHLAESLPRDDASDAQERANIQSLSHSVSLQAWTHAWTGNMREAAPAIEHAESLMFPSGWKQSYIGSGYRTAAALQALEGSIASEKSGTNRSITPDPTTAQKHLAALAEHRSTIEHWQFLLYVEVLVSDMQHGPADALQHLKNNLKRKEGGKAPHHASNMLRALRARLMWQSGKVLVTPKQPLAFTLESVYVALSRGENKVAQTIAAAISDDFLSAGIPRLHAEALLLQAHTAFKNADTETATATAQRAHKFLIKHDMSLPLRALTQEAAVQLQKLVPEFPASFSPDRTLRAVQPLTPAEQRALVHVLQTGSVPAAAAALFLSVDTLKSQMKSVYRKLGVTSRSEAMAAAAQMGLLSMRSD